jgi:hypothetical protein
VSAAPISPASRRSENTAWIRDLARPYLRGYRAVAPSTGSLRGWWFVTGSHSPRAAGRSKAMARGGFFVGYLLDAGAFSFLRAGPPEVLVFAAVQPVGSALHERLVAAPGSLLRRTFEYIRWLTHRPPRFEFFSGEPVTMVRHAPMRDWPAARRDHYARNFFIETLAWLVRSGLVRKLCEEVKPSRRTAVRRTPRRRPHSATGR